MPVYLCRVETRTFTARMWWQFWMFWKWALLPRQDQPGYVPGTILGLFRDAEAANQVANDMGLDDYYLEEVLPIHEEALPVSNGKLVSA